MANPQDPDECRGPSVWPRRPGVAHCWLCSGHARMSSNRRAEPHRPRRPQTGAREEYAQQPLSGSHMPDRSSEARAFHLGHLVQSLSRTAADGVLDGTHARKIASKEQLEVH
eukprot:2290372-Pleurochrysis_carterae.AAC.2